MNNRTQLRKRSVRKTVTKERNIILFNKPFGVLCQFSPDGSNPTLKDYIDAPGYYAAGRLDKDSEGLLVLTNDGRLQHEISHPKKKLAKTYLVQVDGEITPDAIQALTSGVELKDGLTLPASATPAPEPEWLWSRTPPVRIRKSIPTSWLQLQIKEGKNRQVRRMTAAVGFPTLRLIRYAVGTWKVDNIPPGKWLYSQALSPKLV